jgi:hypothetical protein
MAASDEASSRNGTAGSEGTAGRDALYASVGAGLLAFQRLQVARRELERSMNGAGGPCMQLRRGVDGVLDAVEDRLPPPVAEALHRSRDAVDNFTRTLSTVLGLSLPTDRPGPVE